MQLPCLHILRSRPLGLRHSGSDIDVAHCSLQNGAYFCNVISFFSAAGTESIALKRAGNLGDGMGARYSLLPAILQVRKTRHNNSKVSFALFFDVVASFLFPWHRFPNSTSFQARFANVNAYRMMVSILRKCHGGEMRSGYFSWE